ncbi:leucine-rich repeat-containing protein kinase family protein [Hymenobacter cellulosivorans]|uniref:Leucine-rich repeat-containing serine/threonine-protein kinase n=1 Tax=Hymenobacter cellulosivorans TaxID=2932249 RepID=A0ABY4F3W7_9BACT|nr:leucine-rich repeat-containing protein kinase family protein [Hymenobacter cellulosivorans]UOQ50763.1 leucine-rich repeat-containing serine/threonine-protein kinase [Hymenobacter cellulosivorans]
MHTLEQLRSGALAGTTRLDLSGGLTEFPREILDLADTLEVLNLTGNQLSALPTDLSRLRKLRILFCSENRFTEVPAVLGQCPELSMVGFKANQIQTLPGAALPPKLRWLILTDNQLQELPAEIGNCPELQKLMLAGNQLTALPEALRHCHRLELLRLAANRLPELPAWLLALPRLTWLAYAGNPFSEAAQTQAETQHPIREIDWAELELGRRLGEGASGVISQARWQPGNAPAQEVAVKVFKGAVTSDGLPHSEMVACISAGAHPNLTTVDGKIHAHPLKAEGLVLELIPPEFRILAGPPSFETCTRDVYAPGTSFSLGTALRIARGVASAAAHLHQRGILHGDLYAHNILTTPAGAARLSDFGAASFFAPSSALAPGLQRLEVRAFGCLLEELLAHCEAGEADAEAFQKLQELQQRCVSSPGEVRPLFAEVERELAGL